jgi:aminoglycoside phosphotransferase (APT) family kinase protein
VNEAEAASLLQRHGLPDGPLERAYSNSNDVWVGAEHVVRAHGMGPPGRIANEWEAAARVPPEVLYPDVVATGWTDGSDWMIVRRIAGVPLANVWPDLSASDRRRAIHEVAATLVALHSVDPTGLRPPCLFWGTPYIDRPSMVGATVDALRRWEGDDALRDELLSKVAAWSDAVGDGADVTVHGDFHLQNVLWDGRVTAMIDLEWARPHARDLDIVEFIGFCADPRSAVAEELEDVSTPEMYADAPGWLHEAYPALFAHPRLRDRLRLYDVAFYAQGLHHADADFRAGAERRLRAIADGDGPVDRVTW